MVKERTRAILEASVRDFIETGKPVTSESLFARHDFGIKPAMIRWELCDLGEDGYFYQNHPSGGRIPTNKAYRFFIKELMEKEEDLKKRSYFDNLIEDFFEGERSRLIEEMAEYLKTLSVGYEPETEWIMKSGFKEMLEKLEITDRDEILKVVDDFENLPRRLTRSARKLQNEKDWPQVFLGRNPITSSEHLAVIVERVSSKNRNVFIMVIGPKRMDYEKSLGLFRHLEKSI